MRPAKMLEWIGLTIVKKYLSTISADKLEDVHSNPNYFTKGIDLILHHQSGSTTTLDLKVDSYYGSDPDRKIRGLCNPDSHYILLETISQLQYERETTPDQGTLRTRNRPDVPGWFFTGSADEVYYYFLAILSTPSDLRPFYSEYLELLRTRNSTQQLEAKLLSSLRTDQDLLITYRLDKARIWYKTAPPDAFAGYAPAPNPAYITLSRRAHRDRFITDVPANSHGSIFRNPSI
jgi:hypothetical protein